MVKLDEIWRSPVKRQATLLLFSIPIPLIFIIGSEGSLYANIFAWLLWLPLQVVLATMVLFNYNKQYITPRVTSEDLALFLEKAFKREGHIINIVDNHRRRANPFVRPFTFDYIITVERDDLLARIYFNERRGMVRLGPGRRMTMYTVVTVGPITRLNRGYIQDIKGIIEREVEAAPLSKRIVRKKDGIPNV